MKRTRKGETGDSSTDNGSNRFLKVLLVITLFLIFPPLLLVVAIYRYPRRTSFGVAAFLAPWLYLTVPKFSVRRAIMRGFNWRETGVTLAAYSGVGLFSILLGSDLGLAQIPQVGVFALVPHLSVPLGLAAGGLSYSSGEILFLTVLTAGTAGLLIRTEKVEFNLIPSLETGADPEYWDSTINNTGDGTDATSSDTAASAGPTLSDDRFLVPVDSTYEQEGDPLRARSATHTNGRLFSRILSGSTGTTNHGPALDSDHVPLKRNYSTLVLGAPGFGKTEAIRLLVNQLQTAPDEPVIVFDYKSEYQEMFPDEDQIVLSPTSSTHHWNVFAEINDPDDPEQFRTVTERIFPDAEAEELGENRVFFDGARQLLTATLMLLAREDQFENPNNADLREFLTLSDWRQLHEALQRHDDLAGLAATHVDPDAPKMALSHYDFLIQRVRDVFVGDFAAAGTFSVLEYMQDPDGRILILDMPQTASAAAEPAFRFFLDRGMTFALEDPDRRCYFLLDEFARVPHLEEIENLTGAGRAQQAQAILGLQGISQLKSNYDENYADDILASVNQEILLRPGDQESMEYMLDRLGKEQYVVRANAPATLKERLVDNNEFGIAWGDAYQERIEESHRLSESEVQRLDKGEAILINEEGWVQAQLPMWDQLPDRQQAVLARRQ